MTLSSGRNTSHRTSKSTVMQPCKGVKVENTISSRFAASSSGWVQLDLCLSGGRGREKLNPDRVFSRCSIMTGLQLLLSSPRASLMGFLIPRTGRYSTASSVSTTRFHSIVPDKVWMEFHCSWQSRKQIEPPPPAAQLQQRNASTAQQQVRVEMCCNALSQKLFASQKPKCSVFHHRNYYSCCLHHRNYYVVFLTHQNRKSFSLLVTLSTTFDFQA